MAVADSLRAAGCYDLAAVEYERCLFRPGTMADVRLALVRKAHCQKAAGRYAQAAQTIGRYAQHPADYCQQGLCHYLAGNFSAAATSLDYARMLSERVGEDVLLLQVLTLNALQLYDSARAVATLLADTYRASTGDDIAPILDSLFLLTPKLKSENTARWLSFVPGLGHYYAGEYGVGTAAFLLNAALLGFGVWQVFERCYLTAYVGGAGLLSATFPGAMRSAQHYVRKRNHRLTSAFNAAFRDALLERF